MSFDRLIEKIVKTQNPTVVGLDPKLDYVPDFLKKKAFKKYGKNLKGASKAILAFNKAIIDEICDIVPAIKPQAAYYEMYGYEGVKTLYKTIQYAKKKGMFVITDGKRNAIGATMQAYATAHLGEVFVDGEAFEPFGADALTVIGYLGTDGISPLLNECVKRDKGIFVLVKTSNPSSGEFQDQLIDGKPLYEHVGAKVNEWGSQCMGDTYSNVGAVVGATYPEMGKVLRKVMPKAYILVPGYGAQGGKAEDLTAFFNPDGLGAIVNSSRGIIAAYAKDEYAKFGAKNFGEASRQAALDMIADINGALGK